MSVAVIPGTDNQIAITLAAQRADSAESTTNTRNEVVAGENSRLAVLNLNALPATSVSALGLDVITNTAGVVQQQPVANPLHQFESYTYCLSFHMLDINDYNALIGQDNPVYTPKNVLVSSAGRYGSSFIRNKNWTEDFYFDELKFKSTVNTTARNRNNNLYEISFTLIEPLGFTFINRLLATAKEILGNKPGSYIHLPYILQIDFFGTKNGEQINLDNTLTSGPIKGMTKIIPIKLTSVKSKVSQKGTEYQIDAVPFNHQAFNQLYISLPHNTTVTGTKITDIFGSSFDDNNIDTNFIQRNASYQEVAREAAELRRRAYDTKITDEEAQALLTRLSAAQERIQNEYSTFGITGFCDALNAWFQDQKRQGIIGQVSAVQVIFDADIAKDGVLFDTGAPTNVASTPASGNSTTARRNDLQAASNTTARNRGQIVFNGATINIPAGTTIDKLIDWSVRNSKYIGDQILDSSVATKIRNGADPTSIVKTWINWYKIVPKIKVLSFDPLQNRYALAITFYVKKYKLSAKYPYAPKGRVPGYVKRYDYLFTGKNSDVLDLQIDFNTLYLLELTAAQSKYRTTTTAPALGSGRNIDGESPDTNPNLNVEEPPNYNPFPVMTGVVSDTNMTISRPGDRTPLAVKAGDLSRSLMNGARGDMVNVNLRIIGDPHFIKQDDLFLGQNINDINQQFIQNDTFQSLWMDGGELYIFINFESPVDYNETLGIATVADAANPYRYSEFSGVYKIVNIDNTFRNGKFEQSLNVVKLLYDQEGNAITNSATRAETTSLRPAVISLPTRFSGPRINLAALSLPPNSAAGLALAAVTNPQGTMSTLAALGTSIAAQTVGAVAGRLTSNAIDAGFKAVKGIFDGPTYSSNPSDYEIFKATDTQYGAFGEAPTGIPSLSIPEFDAGSLPISDVAGLGLDTTLVDFNLDFQVENLALLDGLTDLDFGADIDFGSFFG